MLAVSAGLSPAAWRIDRDYISERPDTDVGTRSRSWPTEFGAGYPLALIRFRMIDGDGEIYYGGRCTPATEFEPLDNFGMPNAGCTSIEFKVGADWKVL